MLYKNTNAMIHSPDGETDFFRNVSEIFQGDILASYIYNLPWLLTLNITRSNERKWLYTKKDQKQTISCKSYKRHKLCR